MWEIAVHLAVAGGVYDGVFCAVLLSWMGSWTELSQFQRIFLSTLLVYGDIHILPFFMKF